MTSCFFPFHIDKYRRQGTINKPMFCCSLIYQFPFFLFIYIIINWNSMIQFFISNCIQSHSIRNSWETLYSQEVEWLYVQTRIMIKENMIDISYCYWECTIYKLLHKSYISQYTAHTVNELIAYISTSNIPFTYSIASSAHVLIIVVFRRVSEVSYWRAREAVDSNAFVIRRSETAVTHFKDIVIFCYSDYHFNLMKVIQHWRLVSVLSFIILSYLFAVL